MGVVGVEQVVLQTGEGVQRLCVTATRQGRRAMWRAGMRMKERAGTGGEAKLSAAHLRARHTHAGASEMAGALGRSFLLAIAGRTRCQMEPEEADGGVLDGRRCSLQ